ncbi:MAG: UDP-4-amino-4,6-dideoxy-N-acetyl-beta-L-altrosamine N-acetyltransferase [Salinisphaera sp.]|nr:UDP-4-amino-4,6-dideoxy-N-acetyl-beta-L-altrosamine N-acetyltransferase [Salinisphaera sp.]MAS10508.1 UDP-4-amino-4,6-dideoxy-N-acetyl-beta-L-altrosamine N-acetyltransferase [Salinisphaera sp.]
MSAITTGSVRPLRGSELELVRTWRNHGDVRKYMYNQHIISRDEHIQWFERASADVNKYLLLFLMGTHPSGFINLTVRDQQSQRAEWGFYLAPDAARGTGRLLGETALNYVFAVLKLHKLCGEAIAHNDRSIRFHERLGFRREATLREHHFDGSEYHDVVGFGLLKSEWKQERSDNEHA